jgi:hypothetical protein
MTRGITGTRPAGTLSFDYIHLGVAHRAFSGRREDVIALVDICLRATPTARKVFEEHDDLRQVHLISVRLTP